MWFTFMTNIDLNNISINLLPNINNTINLETILGRRRYNNTRFNLSISNGT